MQGRGCQFRRLDDTHVIRERAERELRIRHQPSDDFLGGGRRTRWCSENYWEKSGFVSVVDKTASWVVLYARHDEEGWLPSPSVCRKTCRKFVFTFFFFSSLSRRCSFSHWCQPCLWDETEFRSAPQHYCLLASLAQWPPFCQTFRARLESF